ncbi:type II toxin-antitoxin system HigB family toxin [Botrimarina mediterranea]|uniref:mRNA interferase HigB n=1 Tax=Botrimarina mediterranea TaxID=2528022 RepID=A0A518K6I8_9BACT|nr:type II toxin-antitoxin system HigB family toxin [Botrimarina mediterranea]QDV73400.1 mRNA interferase HigB [Botrimarina mediterranea]QDV77917.1 mRNA interferase HigB [Planctomycetes bacterium K2D]
MRIISRKSLREFWERHPEAEGPLRAWFQVVSRTRFANFAELRTAFPSADKVGRLIVFNIGGNKFRLVASIHFNRGILYVRTVLTHRDYDQGNWQE